MPTTETTQLAKYIPPRTQTPRISSSITERYTVKRGDTLSAIVREHLLSTGRDLTTQALYKGVQQVAKANGIDNPDHILPGQRINLSLTLPRSEDSFSNTLDSTLQKKNVPHPAQIPAGLAAGLSSNTASPFGQVLNGPATLSSPYGLRDHPIHHVPRQHLGIDLAARRNTPITPMRAGKVTYSGWEPGHGNTIIVQHSDGLQTQYSHAAKRLVHTGDRVSAESILGIVGDTGIATGPHLHMEVKRYGHSVNPLPYLKNELNIIP